jgi:DNA-binding NtrC family response regulator
LENALERAATLCEDDLIRAGDLPPAVVAAAQASDPALAQHDDDSAAMPPSPPEDASYALRLAQDPNAPSQATSATAEPVILLKAFLRQQERLYLNRVLQQVGGDKEQAALLVGVSMATLYRKLCDEDDGES